MELAQYADQHAKLYDGRRKRCQTCALPPEIRIQVEQARESDSKPVSFEVISRWLANEGHPVLPYTLRNHFVAGHNNV